VRVSLELVCDPGGADDPAAQRRLAARLIDRPAVAPGSSGARLTHQA